LRKNFRVTLGILKIIFLNLDLKRGTITKINGNCNKCQRGRRKGIGRYREPAIEKSLGDYAENS